MVKPFPNRRTGGASDSVSEIDIGSIDLGIKREGPHLGFLVVNLSGACTSLAELRASYRDLRLTDYPRGHSPDEVASYSGERTWGELSFSFSQRNPDCLFRISFAPR